MYLELDLCVNKNKACLVITTSSWEKVIRSVRSLGFISPRPSQFDYKSLWDVQTSGQERQLWESARQ